MIWRVILLWWLGASLAFADLPKHLGVETWTGGPTLALNYGYDATGALTNLWSGSANGVTNFYQYDLLGRLTNALGQGGSAAGYGYDAVGNLQSVGYGNGVAGVYQYDARNRLTNEAWNGKASFAYQVGPAGNRIAASETVNGTSRNYAWTYDLLYRMTNETIGGLGNAGYGYDNVGNRTNRTSTISQLPAAVSSYNANDLLAGDGYDNNGNTTASGANAYQYDALDHLTNVNSGQIVPGYDGDGNRVSKKVGGVTTYYLVDDRNPSGYAQVVEEWTGSGTPGLSRVYNYGLAVVSQGAPGAGIIYFVADGHGSTRLLLDNSANVLNAFAYDAYGTLIASNAVSQTAYLYCGQNFDSDLGLYYLRARYYKPDTGRFWTMDTDEGDQEDPLSLHKYLYCHNNPVNGVDPSGNDPDISTLNVVTAISVGIGAFSAGADLRAGNYGMAVLDIVGAVAGAGGLIGDLLPPAFQLASLGASELSSAENIALTLKGLSVLVAGTDLGFALTAEEHHLMTNKNRVSSAPNGEGPFTPKFEELLDGTGIDFEDDINKVFVQGH